MATPSAADGPATPADASDGDAVHFVTRLSVRLSLSDVHFDLSRDGSADAGERRVWHFSTTPTHLATMHSGLDRAIARYRSRYGEISAPPADPGTVAFRAEGEDG